MCIFIYSFIDEHLGYLHVLTIVNSAALNLGVHVPVWISFFQYISGIPGSYGSSIFNFLRNFHTVSIVIEPTYTSTYSVEEFPFLHTC